MNFKRTVAVVLAAVLAASAPLAGVTNDAFSAVADDTVIGGDFLYEENGDGTVTIVKYGGEDTVVEIPDIIDNKQVTAIGNSAFAYNDTITSVAVPYSVTSIDRRAFFSCRALKSITLPESLTSIGELALAYCHVLEVVTIPNGVTSIGDEAFESCDSLESITLPASVTSMGDDIFYGCDQLKSIEVSADNNNYSSEDGVLFDKEKTTLILYPPRKSDEKYEIPDTVATIGRAAFSNSSSLTSVIIPDSVMSIDISAFSNCDVLERVTIGKGVERIGDNAFRYSSALESIEVSVENTYYYSYNGVLYGNNKTTLILYPPQKSDVSYDIPEGVTSISPEAFGYCGFLKNVTIPDSMTSIPRSAFYNCHSLKNVTIPDSVTGIAEWAFYNCTSLESITIPDSVSSIGELAFHECSSLESIEVGEGNETYSSIDGVLFSKDKTALLIYPAGKKDETYAIPDGVTELEQYSIIDGSFKCLEIPKSVTRIGIFNFYDHVRNCLKTIKYAGTQEEWDAVYIPIGGGKTDVFNFLNGIEIIGTDFHIPGAAEPEEPEKPETKKYKPVFNEEEFEALGEETKDVLNGIEVVDENGAFKNDIVMRITAIKTTGTLISFDITFYNADGGYVVQPNGMVIVKIPVPEYMKDEVDKIHIYHYDDNGKISVIPSWVDGDYVVFANNHFSVYAVSTTDLTASDNNHETSRPDTSTPDTSTPPPSIPDNTENSNSNSNTGTGSNPNTGVCDGISFAFVPAFVATDTLIATAGRKRKNNRNK